MNLLVPKGYLLTAVCGAALGLTTGWMIFDGKRNQSIPTVQIYQPQTIQSDGSIVLEKKPTDSATPRATVPAHSDVQRVVQIQVKPRMLPTIDGAAPVTDPSPIDLEVSIIKNKDGQTRAIVSSTNGDVIGGIDIPVQEKSSKVAPKWAVGVTYNLCNKSYGAFVSRDLGPFVAGIIIEKSKIAQSEVTSLSASVTLGVRF